jgi:hypothetical protein
MISFVLVFEPAYTVGDVSSMVRAVLLYDHQTKCQKDSDQEAYEDLSSQVNVTVR